MKDRQTQHDIAQAVRQAHGVSPKRADEDRRWAELCDQTDSMIKNDAKVRPQDQTYTKAELDKAFPKLTKAQYFANLKKTFSRDED